MYSENNSKSTAFAILALLSVTDCTKSSMSVRPVASPQAPASAQVAVDQPVVINPAEQSPVWHSWRFFVRPTDAAIIPEANEQWTQSVAIHGIEQRSVVPSLAKVIGTYLSLQWNAVNACYHQPNLEVLDPSEQAAYNAAVAGCLNSSWLQDGLFRFVASDYDLTEDYNASAGESITERLTTVVRTYRSAIATWSLPIVARGFSFLPNFAKASYRRTLDGSIEYVQYLTQGGMAAEETYLASLADTRSYGREFHQVAPEGAPAQTKISRAMQAFLFRRVRPGQLPVEFVLDYLVRLKAAIG